MRVHRLHRMGATVGGAILAVGMLLPAAASAALPARVGPSAITGYLAGPVDLTPYDASPGGVPVPIASLAVGKGAWVASATFDVSGNDSTADMPCRLKAGSDEDRIRFYPHDVYGPGTPHSDGARADAHLSMVVAHAFGDGGGHIVLSCLSAVSSSEPPMRASAIRIVAVKAARLRTEDLADGSHVVHGDTTGSASSTIIHGTRSSHVRIGGNGAPPTRIAELHLGAGSWWVHATALLESRTDEAPVTVTCVLGRSSTPAGSGDEDTASAGMYYAGQAGGRPQVTLDAAMTFHDTGGRARVLCQATDEWDADARWIRITAVKASRLQRLLLPTGQDVAIGSGHPHVVAARRPAPQVGLTTSWKRRASVHLAQGKWLVTAKAVIVINHQERPDGAFGTFLVRCGLVTDRYTDTGTVGTHYASATVPLQMVATIRSAGGANVAVRCRMLVQPPGVDVTVKRIRITALQLGSYTRKHIEP